MDVIFAIRGLLSFVAFTEFTNAVRCFCPLYDDKTKSHVYATLFSGIRLDSDTERTLSHTYGLFSALIGLVIIHAAIFAHYRPLVTLASLSQLLKLIFLIFEAFIFGTIASGQHLIFPIVCAVVSILATVLLLWLTSEGSSSSDNDDDLLKKSKKLRKTR